MILHHNNKILSSNSKIIHSGMITTDSLVLFLDANYYSGSGVWNDLSGQGNNCTLDVTNPPVFNNATKCFEFVEANSTKATILHDASLNFGAGDFTILQHSEWLTPQGSANTLLYKGTVFDANLPGWMLSSGANGPGADIYNVIGDGIIRYEMATNIDTYTWNTQGIIRRNGLIYNIVNGALVPYVTSPLSIDSTTDLIIGFHPFYVRYWTGKLRSVVIYNKGLSDSELATTLRYLGE